MSNTKWGRRKDTNRAYPKGSVNITSKGKYDMIEPPTRNHPRFIIDENMSSSLARELRLMGYDVDDVRELPNLGRGTADRKIKDFAEKENLIVMTRDGPSFPEPKSGGDRVGVEDMPKVETKDEVLRRMKQLGLSKPPYPKSTTLRFDSRAGLAEKLTKAEVVDIDHRRGVALTRAPDAYKYISKSDYAYWIVVRKADGKWMEIDYHYGLNARERSERQFNKRRFSPRSKIVP